VLPLVIDDVDTDQIIPARYLKGTVREGLGKFLFADWRYLPDGSPRPDFALNRPEAEGAQILLAGANFGCGSSREHAPWALVQFGFRAVIAPSFADIFLGNALKNGLLPVTVDATLHRWLRETRALVPELQLTIDLRARSLILPDGEAVQFPIDPFARHCLLEGLDELEYLLRLSPKIAEFEAQHG
jgi:3-isopropylmalate/(R)-2-methylmalate dehydratase small subunit